MTARTGAALAVGALAALGGCVATPPPVAEAERAAAAVPPVPPPLLAQDFEIDGALQQGGWLRGRVPRGAVRLTLGDAAVALTPDGRFFAGIDRDAPPRARLEAFAADGRSVTRELTIAARAWSIERVNVPLRGSVPSATFMATRQPELDAIAAARAVRSDTQGWAQRMIWPVTGRISGRFGSQRIYQGVPGSYHSGLDIAPGAGTPYVAPADGVVVLATERSFTLEGRLLIVDHGMGLNSAFLHSDTLAVKTGDRVRQGQLLGTVGATGRATGPHLHWGLVWQGSRLDPLLFLPER